MALAAFLRDGRSSEASMKFLVLGGISSALLLYGMVFVFGFTGLLNSPSWPLALVNLGSTPASPSAATPS